VARPIAARSVVEGVVAAEREVRIDPLTGAPVHVVSARQDRPVRPADACPFCVGGREAPEPYDVRWFSNRWPAMTAERCEVVLYAPKHGASMWSLGREGVGRVVDVWAERTAALGARSDVEYVLIFENRGAAVGATIDHPHGQIYAFDEIPPVPAGEASRSADGDPLAPPVDPRAVVATTPGWRAWVPAAALYPLELILSPDEALADLPSAPAHVREGLASLLVDVLERCDRLYDMPLPYMLWVHQRPPHVAEWPVRLHLHLVSPLRAAGTWRYIAAGELGSGVYFNPVDPMEAAERLRNARATTPTEEDSL
jgi:UDPglucose--hexose-1-phosphate uridylyltransferase